MAESKMINYLMILPIAVLVTYSQVIMKLRAGSSLGEHPKNFMQQLLALLSDPLVVSAYVAALIGSFGWLYVVSKLPLGLAFPIYIGVIFIMVTLCGWFFLGESLSMPKALALVLIFGGIVLGATADV